MTSNHGSAGANNESGDAKKSSDKQGGGESKEDKEKATSTAEEDVENARISDDVDCFLAILLSLKQNDHDHNNNDQHPPDIPQSSIDKLLSTVELDLTKCEFENKSDKWFVSLLDAVDRVDKLSTALSAFSSSNDDYRNAADHSSSVLTFLNPPSTNYCPPWNSI
ncbi:uncharacterized protein A4U43_C07F18030 [Asparagus officinalis]|uniref:Uncharacterized protein n=1 Tax=Asparagus officinalis TaxID=4686 RepID=A0A5P1ECU3_ASPOF|nr:uncharacterized protein A4U43_C07F18030 [Asparagus officinalis]